MIYIVLFVVSIVLTYMIKAYALKRSVMDIPNERSSHTVPTPRGGGAAIIMVFYMGLFYFRENIDAELFYALLCGLPVALIGLLDDIFTLSSKIRFLVQSVSAGMALYFLGGVTSIEFILFELQGWWVNMIAFFAIVWLTNLYNFLDGIDGYAGSEAVTVGLGLFLLFQNPLGLVIVAAALGFLLFNWHQASIFMGDIGSTTLGFVFAVFVFSDTGNGSIYVWLVLLSLFWFDATLTLVRRYLNGERISQAHKKHGYQRLVQSGWAHDKVVWTALLYNLLFLGLLYYVESGWIVFVLSILSLVGIARFIDSRKAFV
ncbi:MAG TPA: glycosyltransferase family 4 protein [Sulfurovum sp.]|uniref:MraY family glycosyltransferase n=1 Tax=Sulfurovum sp. TaxID=1969726 RepID=UPI002F938E85